MQVSDNRFAARLTLGGSRLILPRKDTEVGRLPTEQQTIAELQPMCSGGRPILAGGRILVAYSIFSASSSALGTWRSECVVVMISTTLLVARCMDAISSGESKIN